jgi:hypothetical protein
VSGLPIQEDRGRLYWRCERCERRGDVQLRAVGAEDSDFTVAVRAFIEGGNRVGDAWLCLACAIELERGAP